MTTVSKRKMIALALAALDEDLYRAQIAVRRAAHRFTQFDATGAIGHLVPLDEALSSAATRAATVLTHLQALPHHPPVTGLDPLYATLQAARAALNAAPRFYVPTHGTDSYDIAAEIEAFLALLGDDT